MSHPHLAADPRRDPIVKVLDLGAAVLEGLPLRRERCHGCCPPPPLAPAPSLGNNRGVEEALLGVALRADLTPVRLNLFSVQGEGPDFDLLESETTDQRLPPDGRLVLPRGLRGSRGSSYREVHPAGREQLIDLGLLHDLFKVR